MKKISFNHLTLLSSCDFLRSAHTRAETIPHVVWDFPTCGHHIYVVPHKCGKNVGCGVGFSKTLTSNSHSFLFF